MWPTSFKPSDVLNLILKTVIKVKMPGDLAQWHKRPPGKRKVASSIQYQKKKKSESV